MTVVSFDNDVVQVFNFGGMELRALSLDGEPWFVAKDVAKVLEYSDAYEITKRLDSDEVQNRQFAGSNPRGENLLNESGLYSAILGSRKPEAKAFKKWVTSEVLPAIRKTGSYAVEKKPETALEWAKKFIESEERRLELETKYKEMKPYADAYADFLGATGFVDCKQASTLLTKAGIKIGRNQLFEKLVEIRWIYPVKGGYAPMRDKELQGLISAQAQTRPDWSNPGQRKVAAPKILISAKGLHKLRDLLLPRLDIDLLAVA